MNINDKPFNLYQLLNTFDSSKEMLKTDEETGAKLDNIVSGILTNKDQLSNANCVIIKNFVDQGINKIKGDTEGAANFMRYTGYGEAYKTLTERQAFLTTVKTVITDLEKSRAAPTDLPPTLPPEAGGPPADLPPVLSRRAPAALPQQPAAADHAVEEKAVQKEAETPVAPQIKAAGAPPPPPNAGGPRGPGGPPPPPMQAKVQKFAGEPNAPSFKPAEYMKLTNQEAQEQIGEIKTYMAGVKAALKPINDSLQQMKKLEDELQLKNEDKTEIANRVVSNGANLAVLKNSPQNEVVHLSLPNRKTGIADQIPFFPNANFEQAKLVRKDLPDALRKETAIKELESEVKLAENELQAKRAEIEPIQKEVDALKAKENNGIKFSEFQKLSDEKTRLLTLWNNGILNRQKKIEGKIKEAPAVAEKQGVEGPQKEMSSAEEALSILSQDALILFKGADKDRKNFFSKLRS